MKVLALLLSLLIPGEVFALIDCWAPPEPATFVASGSIVVIGRVVAVDPVGLSPVPPPSEPRQYQKYASMLTLDVESTLKGSASGRVRVEFRNSQIFGIGQCPFPGVEIGDKVVVAMSVGREALICDDLLVPNRYEQFGPWLRGVRKSLRTR